MPTWTEEYRQDEIKDGRWASGILCEGNELIELIDLKNMQPFKKKENGSKCRAANVEAQAREVGAE